MNILFIVLMGIAMLLTLFSLIGGMFVMIKGGELNEKYGNKFMQARVYLQGIAIACFVGAVFFMDK